MAHGPPRHCLSYSQSFRKSPVCWIFKLLEDIALALRATFLRGVLPCVLPSMACWLSPARAATFFKSVPTWGEPSEKPSSVKSSNSPSQWTLCAQGSPVCASRAVTVYLPALPSRKQHDTQSFKGLLGSPRLNTEGKIPVWFLTCKVLQ